MNNQHKTLLLLYLCQFGDPEKYFIPIIDKLEKSNQLKSRNQNLLLLLRYLEKDWTWKFNKLFKKILFEEKHSYGKLYSISFKPIASFFIFLAKEKKAYNLVESIFRKCPFVNENTDTNLLWPFYENKLIGIYDSTENEHYRAAYKHLIFLKICRKLKQYAIMVKILKFLMQQYHDQ